MHTSSGGDRQRHATNKATIFYLLIPGSLGWADSILFALLWVKWRFRFFVEDFSAGEGEGVEGDGFTVSRRNGLLEVKLKSIRSSLWSQEGRD